MQWMSVDEAWQRNTTDDKDEKKHRRVGFMCMRETGGMIRTSNTKGSNMHDEMRPDSMHVQIRTSCSSRACMRTHQHTLPLLHVIGSSAVSSDRGGRGWGNDRDGIEARWDDVSPHSINDPARVVSCVHRSCACFNTRDEI